VDKRRRCNIKNKNGEIRIIRDKQKNSEYTFVDDGLMKQLLNSTSNQNNDDYITGDSKNGENDKE
jgi:hypothetical protein